MKNDLRWYEGNGAPISERGRVLPAHAPLFDEENPANYVARPELRDAVNVARPELRDAVNVALALGQPLLVTGEPGTGKTRLAAGVAHELELGEPLAFHTKTTSTAADLFYEYDAPRRFQDSRLPDRRDVDIREYIAYRALGLAILLTLPPAEADPHLPEELKGKGPVRSVILIDEIDKAPRDLPNDVLNEFEEMAFTVKETGLRFAADPALRPIVVMTSNSEKNLPDAFLRRCVFYHIPFPGTDQLMTILARRFGPRAEFTGEFIRAVVGHFKEIRKLDLRKKPATAEFLAWVAVLQSLDVRDADLLDPARAEALAMSYSVLAKSREDLARLRRDLEKKIGPAT